MDESLIDQPSNLLLSCLTCGRQKSDYHPDHHQRRCRPHDRTGFLVLDVRVDDLARMFDVRDDGSLSLGADLDARSRARAKWNIALLRLDLHDESRMRLLRKLRAVEALRDDVGNEPSASVAGILDVLERDLAERLPMFQAFGIPISARLHERLVALANEHCRADPGH